MSELGEWVAQRIDAAKKSIDYNAHDLGEFGRMIRVEYAEDVLNDLARKLGVTPK